MSGIRRRFVHRAFIGALMLLPAMPVLADKVVDYTIDPSHTQVIFRWMHAGFSHPGAVFREVTGTIHGDWDDPAKSSVEVTIPLSSLDSFVPLLTDRLLHSGDYFKIDEFPVITFKSTGMSEVNLKQKTFKLQGVLTINGISKPEVLEVKGNMIGEHPFYAGAPAAGFDASTTILRSDFHIGPNVPIVSDEIRVGITVEAVESTAFAKSQAESR